MPTFAELLTERAGVKPGTLLEGCVRQRAGVARSAEFRRIEALPRRAWEEDAELARLMTEALRVPGGTAKLWLVQAVAVKEAFENRGALLSVACGFGKSYLALLFPSVLECERPLVVVPAALRDQTHAKVLPLLRKHWRLHPSLKVIGYSELSLEKNARLLEEMGPDLIIADEVHLLAAPRSARTKRVVRYLKAHPETRVIAMSGTVTKRSLRDYAHIADWCLGARSPLPRSWNELCDWADALDEKVPDERRVPPGALLRLCADGESARDGFRRRLTETPGVVATGEHELGVSLRILRHHVEVPDAVERALRRLRDTWETPDGDLISEAAELWRHARELALGMCYRWDPPAPRDWLEARRGWKALVRETLRHNRRGLDTELQVWNEQARREEAGLPTEEAWRGWRAVRGSFKPNTVATWISDFAVDAAASWLERGPGICWVEHVRFGERLARKTGLPHFGAGDSGILDAEGPVIASRRAHGTGLNLQRWDRCLFCCPMTAGRDWEQGLGRQHRPGQQSDEVTAEVFLHTQELRDAMAQAIADAKYIEETTGGRQRLCYADLDLGDLT